MNPDPAESSRFSESGPRSGDVSLSTPPVIEAFGLQRIFTQGGVETVALIEANVRILPGEMVAIIGPSGSGKSTLMAILGLLDRPTSGVYRFNGRDVTHLSDDDLSRVRNLSIGFVFQSFNLLSRATVVENVELPQVYAGTARKVRRERARELLELVGLGHRLDHRPNQISGGEMQRVAIARSLANSPSMLLADEPTGNLDSRVGKEILSLFRQLNRERGMTEVIVTHDNQVAAQCDRVIEIRDGRTIHA